MIRIHPLIRERRSSDIDSLTNSFLVLGPYTGCAKFHKNRTKIAIVEAITDKHTERQTDRQTDRQSMYSSGTDNKMLYTLAKKISRTRKL